LAFLLEGKGNSVKGNGEMKRGGLSFPGVYLDDRESLL